MFKQLWSLGQASANVDVFTEEMENEMIRAFSFVGEEFINRARNISTYQDRTGNLRASIWYLVLSNGKQKKKSYISKRGEQDQSQQMVTELSSKYNEGIVLIVGAGMEYAAYVEAKGYDVLTGSAPSDSQLLSDLKSLLE